MSKQVYPIKDLKLAVIGHQEWVNFLVVDALPSAGLISRASRSLEEPAGAGAVVAVQLAQQTGRRVSFFTALGRDHIAERSVKRLQDLGVDSFVAWRKGPSRRGISLSDASGDRAITVIGERHTPGPTDKLPWHLLETCDGVFVSATDSAGLKLARKARVLTATPRLGMDVLQSAEIQLDALIGSDLDPGEQIEHRLLKQKPLLIIATKGAEGGSMDPGGSYKAIPARGPIIDTYGCGDSFAAGVTAGLAAGFSADDSVRLGAQWGADCATRFGPYE